MTQGYPVLYLLLVGCLRHKTNDTSSPIRTGKVLDLTSALQVVVMCELTEGFGRCSNLGCPSLLCPPCLWCRPLEGGMARCWPWMARQASCDNLC